MCHDVTNRNIARIRARPGSGRSRYPSRDLAILSRPGPGRDGLFGWDFSRDFRCITSEKFTPTMPKVCPVPQLCPEYVPTMPSVLPQLCPNYASALDQVPISSLVALQHLLNNIGFLNPHPRKY